MHSRAGIALSLSLSIFGVACSSAKTQEIAKPTVTQGECSRHWAHSASPDFLRGLGLSGEKEAPRARAQAKALAFKDLAEQIYAQVHSNSQLSETDVGSAFQAKTEIGVDVKDLMGARVVLEGSNSAESITACVVIEYDIKAAQKDSEARMKVLGRKIEKTEAALASENWGDFLKDVRPTLKILKEHQADIVRADALRVVLGLSGRSHFERFEGASASFENGMKSARERLRFVMPIAPGFEEAIEDARSRVRSLGFTVVQDQKELDSESDALLGVLLALKPAGAIRKTQTSLGLTVTGFVGVEFKDLKTGRDIGSARGASVSGASPTGDEQAAQHNLQRQAALQLVEAIKKGIPGVFGEQGE